MTTPEEEDFFGELGLEKGLSAQAHYSFSDFSQYIISHI